MPNLSFEEAQEAAVRKRDGIPATESQLAAPQDQAQGQATTAVSTAPSPALNSRQHPADQVPTSWAGRYGQVILQAGIAAIPFALYRYQGQLSLSTAEVWFVSQVLADKWDTNLPHPSLHAIEAHSGASLSQLKRIRTALKNQHYLEVQVRYDDHTAAQQPSSYDFSGLFHQIELLLIAENPALNAIAAEDTPAPTPAEVAGDTSFVARYGRVIAKAGIAAIPLAIFNHQKTLGLKPTHVWFTCYILAHRWSSDLPYPSLKKMAERTGYSQEHIHTIKDELVQMEYLRVINRHGPQGNQINNAYDFSGLLTALAELTQPTPVPSPPADAPARRARPRRGRATPEMARHQQTARARPTMRELTVPVHTVRVPIGSERSSLTDSSLTDSSFSQVSGPPLSQLDGPPPSQVSGPPLLRTPSPLSGERPSPSQVSGPPSFSGERPSPSQVSDPSSLSGERPSPLTQEGHLAARSAGSGEHLPDSAWLRKITEDFTRELEIPLQRGSDASRIQVAGNITQTLALWRASRLSEEPFAALMQEARSRTQQAKGQHSAPGLVRPMAYFYTVLADLIAHSSNDAPTAQRPACSASRALTNPSTTTRRAPTTSSFAFQFTKPQTTQPVPSVSPDEADAESGPAAPTYSPYIAGVMLDYARELGAGYQGPTHVTAALRLWQTSGLGETAFVTILHMARRQVRSNGPVNVMPQFFAVVAALLAQST